MGRYSKAFESYLSILGKASSKLRKGKIADSEYSELRNAALARHGESMDRLKLEALLAAVRGEMLDVTEQIYELKKQAAKRGIHTKPTPGIDPERLN